MAPLLVSDDFNSSSTLKAVTLERLSAGCLSASGHKERCCRKRGVIRWGLNWKMCKMKERGRNTFVCGSSH